MNDSNYNNCKLCSKVLWGGIPVSIALMLTGAAIFLRPAAAGAETVMVAAIALLIESLDLLRRGIYMAKSKSTYALMQFAITLLTAFAAILMLTDPFHSQLIRARFCGATIAALGIMTLAGSLICRGFNND